MNRKQAWWCFAAITVAVFIVFVGVSYIPQNTVEVKEVPAETRNVLGFGQLLVTDGGPLRERWMYFVTTEDDYWAEIDYRTYVEFSQSRQKPFSLTTNKWKDPPSPATKKIAEAH